jgi:hypothetical protein
LNSNVGGALALAAGLASTAHAQYAIDWYNYDGSGTTENSTGGTYAVAGTCGQWDPGTLAGGTYKSVGGFWAILGSGPACYANCDGNTSPPLLSASDFVCFLAKFRAGDPYANCDGNTTPPLLSASDFVCYLAKFRAGCP